MSFCSLYIPHHCLSVFFSFFPFQSADIYTNSCVSIKKWPFLINSGGLCIYGLEMCQSFCSQRLFCLFFIPPSTTCIACLLILSYLPLTCHHKAQKCNKFMKSTNDNVVTEAAITRALIAAELRRWCVV